MTAPMLAGVATVYHTGFAVADLEAAQRMFSDALGVEWAPIHLYEPLRLWTPGDGWIEVRIRVSYSRPSPHQLEVIEGPRGSFFDPALMADARHLGVWTDEVGADAERLLGLGWRILGAKGSPEQLYGDMAYLAPPAPGPVIELVSTRLRPMLLAWFDEPYPEQP